MKRWYEAMRFANLRAGRSLLIVSFFLLNNEESGKPIPKRFAISKIKFANPILAFGKVANLGPSKFATLPLPKTPLANFNLLNLINLNPSLPFCRKRGRGAGVLPIAAWQVKMMCISPPERQPHQQRQLIPKLRGIGNLTTWTDDDWTGWHIGAAWGVKCIVHTGQGAVATPPVIGVESFPSEASLVPAGNYADRQCR